MLKNDLALKDPALLYKMLLEEKAKEEIKGISKAAQDFLNAVRDSLEELMDYYKEKYGDNWQEVLESDWEEIYYEILEDKKSYLLEYFRSII